MIAIGCATTDEQAFRAAAAQTIEVLDEGHSVLLRRHGHDTIDGPYNEMIDAVADRNDLEAVVLVHQDTAIDLDANAMAQIRGLLAAPDIAVVAAVDGFRPRELAFVEGTLLALSPWTARNLRFDPAVGGSVDASAQDLALRVRAAGRRVVGAPLGVVRVRSARGARAGERQRQFQAMVALRRKWRPEALRAAEPRVLGESA